MQLTEEEKKRWGELSKKIERFDFLCPSEIRECKSLINKMDIPEGYKAIAIFGLNARLVFMNEATEEEKESFGEGLRRLEND